MTVTMMSDRDTVAIMAADGDDMRVLHTGSEGGIICFPMVLHHHLTRRLTLKPHRQTPTEAVVTTVTVTTVTAITVTVITVTVQIDQTPLTVTLTVTLTTDMDADGRIDVLITPVVPHGLKCQHFPAFDRSGLALFFIS